MSKERFSEGAASKLQDLESLKSRYETYEVNVNNSALSETDKLCAKVDSSMSVIEGLGSRLLMTFASEEEIQNLTNSLHSAAKNSRMLLTEQKDQDKNILASAKTEAALKGFVLPVIRDGNFEGLEQYNLSPKEIDIAFSATKKALLALADKQIPPKEYAAKIQEEYIKIIQKEHKFDENKINAFQDFAAQGVKSKQDKGITAEERKALTNSATKSCNEFKVIFGENEQNIKKAQLVNELVKNFETKGKKISKETRVKFTELVDNITKDLGSDYIQNNLSKVAGALSKEIDKNKTLISGIRNDLKISSAKLDKVTGKINSEFKKDALQFNSQEALNERLGPEKKELPKAVVKASPTLQTPKPLVGKPPPSLETKVIAPNQAKVSEKLKPLGMTAKKPVQNIEEYLGPKKEAAPKINVSNSPPTLPTPKPLVGKPPPSLETKVIAPTQAKASEKLKPLGLPPVYNMAKNLGNGIASQHTGPTRVAPPSLKTPPMVLNKSNKPTGWGK